MQNPPKGVVSLRKTQLAGMTFTTPDPKTVTIKLTRSPIGFNKNQATVVQSIGLRKINHAVTL